MIRKVVEKIGAPWLFLLAVCLLYGVLALIDSRIALAGLESFARLALNILPVLAGVFALLFLFNLFVDTKKIARFLGRGSRKAGWLLVVLAGILSAGPIYLWYPLLSDLKEKGMREGLIATFLYNRAVKIPLLPVMVFYFGIEVVAILTVYMVAFSILHGYLLEKILYSGGKEP
jgi:uncharacterized membrane protein YraQ (UPF0718 family)